jgi:hypothetical protein
MVVGGLTEDGRVIDLSFFFVFLNWCTVFSRKLIPMGVRLPAPALHSFAMRGLNC